MKFEVYPWQMNQWQQLIDTHKSGRLPHALLLSGPDGVGMEHFAMCFSAYLLCREKAKAYACGNCKSCVLFKTDNHPDMYRLEPEETAKQIKVDDIRRVIEYIQLSSHYTSNKIALISPAEAMNRNAANALLKTIEEPPPEVIFLLVTSVPARLPVTIRSRCQAQIFSRVSQDLGVDWLSKITGMEGDGARELLNLAQGRPILALEMSENDSIANQKQVLSDLNILSRAPSDVIGIAHQWHDYGTSEVFKWLLGFLTRMARMKLIEDEAVNSSSQVNRDLQGITNQLNLTQLVGCYDLAMQHYRAVTGPFNLNRMGLLEDFIIYWQSQNNIHEEMR
jgi:DNA polymerase III subunit delta'